MTISIILARGGSKGLPGKNIRMFCGKPLLAWSILQAPKPVAVSSDSDEILAVAREYGAMTIKRTADLASDTATSESALKHALGSVGEVSKVIFLQPTSPLRRPHDIENAIAAFDRNRADSLFSCSILEDACIWEEENGRLYPVTYDPVNRGRRQERKPLFLENGSIYIFKPAILAAGNRLGGKIIRFVQAAWQSVEIDDLESFDLARFYFKRYRLEK